MLSPLLVLIPLLAIATGTVAKPHHPRAPTRGHGHGQAQAERDQSPPPFPIFNNALLIDRAEANKEAARQHFELLGEPLAPESTDAGGNGNGQDEKKVVKRVLKKKRACKAKQSPEPTPSSSPTSSSSASVIGQNAMAKSASRSASPSSSSAEKGSMLFPVGRGTASWTTKTGSPGALSISDALKPLSAGELPAQGTAPDGSTALVANFPAGTVKLASGQGFSFYTEGSHNGVYAPGAKEVVFSYSAFFEAGFQFNKGGKMPGLFGGTSFATAKSCSGGKQDGRDECFSARYMWRADGMGEAYNYFPESVQQYPGYCSTPPMSVCDPAWGDSIGRGSFNWTAGQWTTVALRLRLNDYGQANGEQEIFVNGKSALKLSGLKISVNPKTKIYGIMAQTFFGGSDSSWASPRTQNIWFKDFSFAVIA